MEDVVVDMAEEKVETILQDKMMTITIHLKGEEASILKKKTRSNATYAKSTDTIKNEYPTIIEKGRAEQAYASETQENMILACKTNETCKNNMELWYLDSRCSNHMSERKELLSRLNKSANGEKVSDTSHKLKSWEKTIFESKPMMLHLLLL